MNFKQRWSIDQKNKQRWLEQNPSLNDNAGIYVLTREENGFKFAYIGQSKHILQRLAEHLRGYQHIDKSLRKHKLWSKDNPTGWSLDFFVNCEENMLDSGEQYWIKEYASQGYQLRNKTAGGQVDKVGFDMENTGGYRRGVAYGRAKAIKDIAVFFDKYLDFVIKGQPNKIKERKLQEFEDLLKGEK